MNTARSAMLGTIVAGSLTEGLMMRIHATCRHRTA